MPKKTKTKRTYEVRVKAEPEKAPGTASAASELQRVADIVKQRSGTHGDAIANLTDIARRWTAHIQTKYGTRLKLDAVDVAAFMIEMKLSRANYGDACELDHSRDIMGYAAIQAAAIAAKAEKSK